MPPPFPFIVGCERSGTTLLRLMLDAHQEMAIPPESDFLVGLRRAGSRVELPDGRVDRESMRRRLAESASFLLWELPDEAVRAALADGPDPLGFADAVRRLFAAYAAQHGKPRYGDKTPAHVLRIAHLVRLFPEARFIHLIRDGRDVALSLSGVSWGPGDVVASALHWRERVRRGIEAGRPLGPERYLEVRYERLVAEPEPALREIAAFVDLEFDAAMLRHHERATPPPGEVHRRSARPVAAGVRDWRRDMDPSHLEAVEAVAGDLLSELGYERAFPHPSDRARAAARRAEARRGRARRWHRTRARVAAALRGKRTTAHG